MTEIVDIFVKRKLGKKVGDYRTPDGIIAEREIVKGIWHVLCTREQAEQMLKDKEKLLDFDKVDAKAKKSGIPIHVYGPDGYISEYDRKVIVKSDGTEIDLDAVVEPTPPPPPRKQKKVTSEDDKQ